MKNINKKKILKYISIFSIFLIVLGVVLYTMPNALADVGNNNRYDSGGGSSSSSSSDGDSGFLIYIIFSIFRLIGPIPTVILILICYLLYRKAKKNGKFDNLKNSFHNISNTNNTSSINQEDIVNEIRTNDPQFSSDAFLSWTKEVFMTIQEAWTKREWKTIRPFESNELFNVHSKQLQEYINNNKINVVEKININSAKIKSHSYDGDLEVIVVELRAIMRDYVIDATTRKVLESDPNKDWYMNYNMTFNRKNGVKTKLGTSNKSTTNCPNCGAPTTITSSGQCEYCDSVITTGEHDWVLSDITSFK